MGIRRTAAGIVIALLWSGCAVINGLGDGEGKDLIDAPAAIDAFSPSDARLISGTVCGPSRCYMGDQSITTATPPSIMMVTESNNDGKQDILVAAGTKLYTYRDLGNQAPDVQDFTPNGITAMTRGDFDGDATPDAVIVFGSAKRIVIQYGHGNRTQDTTIDLQDIPYVVAAGRIDGDSSDDLAIVPAGRNSAVILLAKDNFAATVPAVTTANMATAVGIAKTKSAAPANLIVAHEGEPPGLWVHLGNGDGTFGSYLIHNGENYRTNTLAFWDVDDMGGEEIIVMPPCRGTCADRDIITVYQHDGSKIGAYHHPASLGPFAMHTGDFDLDGGVDIAVVGGSDDSVELLLLFGGSGFGSGGDSVSFAAVQEVEIGASGESLSVGKINGDDQLDIAVGIPSSNTVRLLLSEEQ